MQSPQYFLINPVLFSLDFGLRIHMMERCALHKQAVEENKDVRLVLRIRMFENVFLLRKNNKMNNLPY